MRSIIPQLLCGEVTLSKTCPLVTFFSQANCVCQKQCDPLPLHYVCKCNKVGGVSLQEYTKYFFS